MAEETENTDFTYTLPTELLIDIFFYLPAKEMMKCRSVCQRWRLIIDRVARSDKFWCEYCEKDYGEFHWLASKKVSLDLTSFDLYRSLSVWPILSKADEEADEFAAAERIADEVRSVEVLGNGILSVHKKSAIEYYNIETLKLSPRGAISGDYARYSENDSVIVIQSYHLHLFILRKVAHPKTEHNTTYDNVKMYLLTDTELFYVKLNDEIYVCNLYNEPLTRKFIKRAEDLDGVMCLGYSDGCLNVLTYQRNIYKIINNKDMVFKQSLNTERNLLDVLHKYNFLEQLDWRVYFQWMYALNHRVPESPMRDIIIIRPYGDIFFVGSNFGVLCIFYKPYADNGELDLFNTQPERQVNFMERSDIPVLATCPILQIDVVETHNGHTVFVAMPKKVAVLKFTHSFINPIAWSGDEYGHYCDYDACIGPYQC